MLSRTNYGRLFWFVDKELQPENLEENVLRITSQTRLLQCVNSITEEFM